MLEGTDNQSIDVHRFDPPLHNVSLARRRSLRCSSTDAERLLWRLLRSRQLSGAKFRRQQPVGPYYLDFFCVAENMAIELDGSQHYSASGVADDAIRTEFLVGRGIWVLRFSDRDVLTEPASVLSVIIEALGAPHPDPLPRGEGIAR